MEGATDAVEGMVAMEEAGEGAMAGIVVVVMAGTVVVVMGETVVEVVMEVEEGTMAVVEVEVLKKG